METSTSIANRFYVSDTYVHEVFERYVKMDRLPLTDVISVDEVHVELDEYCKYALVIQDFHTGDPIDLLRSRRSNVTEPYFVSIPLEERAAVKYLISDMYNQYINYVDKYFPNAVPVVDSFHVIQWITRLIDNYFRQLLKKFRARDKEREDQLSFELQQPVSLPPSDEVYLLRKYRWLVLSSQSNIKYHTDPRMDPHFRCLMNTFDYEDALFRIDPKLRDFRDLKEVYIRFNNRNAGNPISARIELADVIKQFHSSEHEIFREFADLLEKYQDPIINFDNRIIFYFRISNRIRDYLRITQLFVMVEKYGHGEIYDSRLSNGPMEALNRKVKDLKRLGRGYKNFEHFRNRFLYSTRSNPVLNGSIESSQVQYFDNDDF